MAHYDQRGQKVNTQLNADTINIHLPAKADEDFFQQGINALQGKLYSRAIDCLEQAIGKGQRNSDLHYYLALAFLDGKRPRLLNFTSIQRIEEHLEAATELDADCSHAYILWALVKYDYYVMNKMYEKPPTVSQLIKHANSIKKIHVAEILSHIHAPENQIWELLRSV